MNTLLILAAALGNAAIVNLIVGLLLIAVVTYIVFKIVALTSIPAPLKEIFSLVIGVLLLLWLLNHLNIL